MKRSLPLRPNGRAALAAVTLPTSTEPCGTTSLWSLSNAGSTTTAWTGSPGLAEAEVKLAVSNAFTDQVSGLPGAVEADWAGEESVDTESGRGSGSASSVDQVVSASMRSG